VKTHPAIIIILSIVLLSCRGSSPIIHELDWRILYRDDGTTRHEELSIFLRISDPDGSDDPAMITVIAGDTGFVWNFQQHEWVLGSAGGREWTGLPSLMPLSGFRMPDSLYVVRLEDLAGHSYETSFRPDPDRPSIDKLEWPVVSLENGIIRFTGSTASAWFILRDENLNPQYSLSVGDGDAVDTHAAHFWELWIDDLSEPFRLGPFPILASDSE